MEETDTNIFIVRQLGSSNPSAKFSFFASIIVNLSICFALFFNSPFAFNVRKVHIDPSF